MNPDAQATAMTAWEEAAVKATSQRRSEAAHQAMKESFHIDVSPSKKKGQVHAQESTRTLYASTPANQRKEQRALRELHAISDAGAATGAGEARDDAGSSGPRQSNPPLPGAEAVNFAAETATPLRSDVSEVATGQNQQDTNGQGVDRRNTHASNGYVEAASHSAFNPAETDMSAREIREAVDSSPNSESDSRPRLQGPRRIPYG